MQQSRRSYGMIEFLPLFLNIRTVPGQAGVVAWLKILIKKHRHCEEGRSPDVAIQEKIAKNAMKLIIF